MPTAVKDALATGSLCLDCLVAHTGRRSDDELSQLDAVGENRRSPQSDGADLTFYWWRRSSTRRGGADRMPRTIEAFLVAAGSACLDCLVSQTHHGSHEVTAQLDAAGANNARGRCAVCNEDKPVFSL